MRQVKHMDFLGQLFLTSEHGHRTSSISLRFCLVGIISLKKCDTCHNFKYFPHVWIDKDVEPPTWGDSLLKKWMIPTEASNISSKTYDDLSHETGT